MYVVAASNIPETSERYRGDSKPGALGYAKYISKQVRRVSFGVYDVQSDGSYQIATYMDGRRTFTALSEISTD